LRNLYPAEDSYFGATPLFKADTTGGMVRYDFSQPLLQPERLFDVEAGARYKSEDVRLSVNAYWMEFTDELVKTGLVDIFGEPITVNAKRTRHIGLEVDGAATMSAGLSVSGNFTVSHNRLVHYSIIDNGFPVVLDGNPIAGFPDVLGNLRITYRGDPFTSSIAVKYVGPFHTDNFNNDQNRNDAYTVCNGEVLYHVQDLFGVGLTFRGEVRNIFDSLYFTSGEGNAFFPAAERNYVFGITASL
jgi:iron complex outermembrane receptor protein